MRTYRQNSKTVNPTMGNTLVEVDEVNLDSGKGLPSKLTL